MITFIYLLVCLLSGSIAVDLKILIIVAILDMVLAVSGAVAKHNKK